MAAGQDSEAIIATLEEAKVKLGEAQRHTFAGLTRLGKIRSAIEFTLGRFGRGNPAITLLRDAEKSIKDRAVEINGLSSRVDKAIAEIREAAGGSGPLPGPTSRDIVPASRPHTYYVMEGNTAAPVHNADRGPNWSSKSRPTFGHTFSEHGAGAKNTRSLTDRARSTGQEQGQWLDNDAAAVFLKGLHVGGAGPRSVRIPDGLGQVIMPDGQIVPAKGATFAPGPNGLYRTVYPIIGPR